MMVEEWRPIPSAPAYEVSSLGRVRRATGGGSRAKIGRILKVRTDRHGYVRTNLQVIPGGPPFARLIHQLVCEAFHGPKPSPTHEVAHNDGDRTNNRIENLRWATPAENSADRLRHGRKRPRLSAEAIREMRAKRQAGASLALLSAELGLTRARIARVTNGQTYRHVA